MGCCFSKGRLQKFDNNTQIYNKCTESEKKKASQFSITLEGDVYLLCPDRNRLLETDQIFKREEGLLTLLKDQTGIKTGEHCIKNCFYQILENASQKNFQSIVFNEPKISDENKAKLFKNLVTSIYIFDKRKPKQKYKLKKIYIPWRGLPQNIMDSLLQESIFSVTVLVD